MSDDPLSCDECDALIESVAADERPVDGVLASHLASCARCARRLTLARRVDAFLFAQSVPALRPEFVPTLVARVRRERWRSEQLFDLAFNLVVALAILVGVGGVGMLVSASGFGAIGSDFVTAFGGSVATALLRTRPLLPVYGLAVVVLVMGIGLWWWAEGLEA